MEGLLHSIVWWTNMGKLWSYLEDSQIVSFLQSDISHFQPSTGPDTVAGTVNNISWKISGGNIMETHSKEMPSEVSALLLWLSCLKNISHNVPIGISLTVICDYFPKETTSFYHFFQLSFVLILSTHINICPSKKSHKQNFLSILKHQWPVFNRTRQKNTFLLKFYLYDFVGVGS